MYVKYNIDGIDVNVSDQWSGHHKFVESMTREAALDLKHRIVREEQLIRMGIKLLHPNDGWVTRNDLGIPIKLYPSYPRFNYNPLIGDLIALGYASRLFKEDFLICEVLKLENSMLSKEWIYHIKVIRHFPQRKSFRFKKSKLGKFLRKIRIAWRTN